MALVSPSYVQGNYTVAQRDAIFAKADKYPDAAGALQNQVPTIFPDGSIGWRQIPQGGDGTANANIAVVESTQYASKAYYNGDLLIYNDQLYRVISNIAVGAEFRAGINITATRVDNEMVPQQGKGINMLDNWLWNPSFGFPINQRGESTYTGAGGTINRWHQTNGTTELVSGTPGSIRRTAPANQSSDFYQIIYNAFGSGYTFCFSVSTNAGKLIGSANLYNTSAEIVVDEDSYTQLILQKLDSNRLKACIRTLAGKSMPMFAAKLECGTRQSLVYTGTSIITILDPPPNYQQELAKCQRYLTPIKTGDLLHGINLNGTFFFEVPTHVQMAAAPTLTSALSLAIVAGGAVEAVSVPAATQGTVGGTGVGFTVGVSTIGNLQTAVAQVQANTFLSCE